MKKNTTKFWLAAAIITSTVIGTPVMAQSTDLTEVSLSVLNNQKNLNYLDSTLSIADSLKLNEWFSSIQTEYVNLIPARDSGYGNAEVQKLIMDQGEGLGIKSYNNSIGKKELRLANH